MNWPQATAVCVVAGMMTYASTRPAPAPATATHEPCVAFSFLPDIPGYEPERMQPTVVFIDAPVFDRLFAGCDEPERHGILAIVPGNVVRVLRRERK